MVRGRRAEPEERVLRITTAAESPSVDREHRQRRYVLSMTIRTLCFVGAVFARSIPWLCIVLIAASFFLPYIAVVMANQANPSPPTGPVEGPGQQFKELR
ncbi:MAG: DUF3099 domain-containing protein [Marmoricola sp.]